MAKGATSVKKQLSVKDEKKVRVGCLDFGIVICSRNDILDSHSNTFGNMGNTEFFDLIIRIGEDMKYPVDLLTLLHEIFHASLQPVGRKVEDEEDAANHFAELVYSMCRDNRWLKHYLFPD